MGEIGSPQNRILRFINPSERWGKPAKQHPGAAIATKPSLKKIFSQDPKRRNPMEFSTNVEIPNKKPTIGWFIQAIKGGIGD